MHPYNTGRKTKKKNRKSCDRAERPKSPSAVEIKHGSALGKHEDKKKRQRTYISIDASSWLTAQGEYTRAYALNPRYACLCAMQFYAGISNLTKLRRPPIYLYTYRDRSPICRCESGRLPSKRASNPVRCCGHTYRERPQYRKAFSLFVNEFMGTLMTA
ncbi:hypothetical protein TSAR_001171 [Trichomalopsis sarcophagae]|uniref:Uncharacterized protein n=1 Tax=Trichomalopsis sarcophagae TaxID=543379 RepID=A0A232FNA9_9HYME|nr:hypothetical protein TSAR_001171 [Trichomalopsis sarcophagae]